MSRMWALPEVDETRCTLCGLCVQACSCHAVKLGDRGPVFSCPDVCPTTGCIYGCCLCEDVCPNGAITYTFEIVMEAQEGRAAMSTA